MAEAGHASHLAVRNLEAWYGSVQALFGVDISIDQGSVVALVGTNGAGKTTTIRAILGLIRARGEVWAAGERVDHVPCHKRVSKCRIGVVHEGRGLFGPLSVLDNLTAGLKRPKDVDLVQAFRHFSFLEARLMEPVNRLSGGEQQMVAFGRLLLRDPQLILVDEPCLGLSPAISDRIYEHLADLRAEGRGILLVEQNIRRAQSIADHLYLIQRGRSSAVVDAHDEAAVQNLADIALGKAHGAA